MPGDNFSRRVARAAAVGGGRTYRSQTPVIWYATLLAICLAGVGLVGYSRYERVTGVTPPAAAAKAPTAADEWEAAVAVDVCGKLIPYALPATTDPQAAYANIGDGVVDIEPQRSPEPKLYEGSNAVLSGFLTPEGVVLSATSLRFPGKPVKAPPTTTSSSTTTTTPRTTSSSSTSSPTTSSPTTSSPTASTTAKSKNSSTTSSPSTTTTTVPTVPGPAVTYKNGEHCGSRPGTVQVKTWPTPTARSGTLVTSKFGSIALKNGELITIAFVPKDTPILKPLPAAVKQVSQFLIVNPGGVAPTTTTTLPTTVPSTTGSSSTTSSTTGGSTPSSTVTSST